MTPDISPSPAVITGTTGDDTADSFASTDADEVIDGRAGNDVIDGKGGADTLTGGAGNDIFVLGAPVASKDAADVIADFQVNGDADTLRLPAGVTDVFYTRDDGDTILYAAGDTPQILAVLQGFTGTLDASSFDTTGGNVAPTAITYFDNVEVGTEDNDSSRLNRTSGDDIIYGLGGDDVIDGDGGDDTLYGGAGTDELHGDAGDDTLYGGAGTDELDGGRAMTRSMAGLTMTRSMAARVMTRSMAMAAMTR